MGNNSSLITNNRPLRKGFARLKVPISDIKQAIFSHPEFVAYSQTVNAVFAEWKSINTTVCKSIDTKTKPKKFIHALSEDLLQAFDNFQLIDKYDVYQHLMTYWMETMQDDVYLIVSDSWTAGNDVEWTKKEFEGKLIPKLLMINSFFAAEQKKIDQLEANRDALAVQIEELEEEHGGEDGYFVDFEKINKNSVNARLKEISQTKGKANYKMAAEPEAAYGERAILEQYIELCDKLANTNRKIKEAKVELDKLLLEKYPKLTNSEIKKLVVEDKWMATIENTVHNEMQRISQRLTSRIKELAERYESPLHQLTEDVDKWAEKVNQHLAHMGFVNL